MADEEDAEEEDAPEDLDDEDEDGEGAQAKGAGKKKLILILLAVTLVLLAMIGGGLYLTGLLDPLLGIEEVDPEAEEAVVTGKVFYKLKDFTLNLSSEDSKSRFLKIGLTLVLLNELDIPRVEALVPRIQGNVTGYLRGLKPEELAGSANFYRLRQGILLRVRVAVAPTVVTDILFNSALVQ